MTRQTPGEDDRGSGPPPGRPTDAVRINSSLRGLTAAAVTPALLVALGLGALPPSGGRAPVPIGVVVLGLVLAVGVLLDFPRHCWFDGDGVTRVCPLRRQRLSWREVQAIERTPRSTASRLRRPLAGRDGSSRPVAGGLVARGHGRRRYLLTDRVEGAAEYDRLRALLSGPEVATVLRARRPHESAPPSDLTRRRR